MGEKNTADYKKFSSNRNAIKKRGVCSKTEKTIGIRHHYIWLQLTFRYKWEFDKFLLDSRCYGLADECTTDVIRKYKDLQQVDYRLMAMPTWDSYNMADVDGTYSGNVVDFTAKATPRNDDTHDSVSSLSSTRSLREKKSKKSTGGKSSGGSW